MRTNHGIIKTRSRTAKIYRVSGWFYICEYSFILNIVLKLFAYFEFFFFFLPVLISELIKMYNSGNSAIDMSKIVYFG